MNSLIDKPSNFAKLRILCVLFGVGFIFMFWVDGLGINYPIYTLFVFAATYWALKKTEGFDIKAYFAFCAVAFILSAKFAYSLSGTYRTLNFAFVPILYILGVLLSVGEKSRIAVKFFALVFRSFSGIISLPGSFVKKHSLEEGQRPEAKSKDNTQSNQILLGVVFAILALSLIVPLMISADEAFAHFARNLFTESFYAVYIPKLLVFLLVSGYAFGFIMYASKGIHDKSAYAVQDRQSMTIPFIMLKTFLMIVGCVFMLFALVQASYLFLRLNTGLDSDFSYAEYARNGCFQLWALTLINSAIVLFSMNITKNAGEAEEKYLKALYTLFSSSNLIMSAAAFYKMFMYYREFGLTSTRLIVFAMLFVQLIGVGMIFIWIYRKKFPIVKFLFIAACTVYCCLSIINADNLVARCNIARFEESGKIDLEYLSQELSDDALDTVCAFVSSRYKVAINRESVSYEEFIQAEDEADNSAEKAAKILSWRLERLHVAQRDSSYKSFNLMMKSLAEKCYTAQGN